ncbi:hypothetical protein AgCh_013312 [Apium graveolens]
MRCTTSIVSDLTKALGTAFRATGVDIQWPIFGEKSMYPPPDTPDTPPVEGEDSDSQKTHKVVVKGEKADPLKVLARVQRKSHRHVELLSPIPPPPAECKKPEEKDIPKPPEKKEVTSWIEISDTDLKGSQVTVKRVFDPVKLVEYMHKKAGKHAIVIKQEPEKNKEEVKGLENQINFIFFEIIKHLIERISAFYIGTPRSR